MKMPNPKATTTTEAYLAYKAGVIAEDELKPKLYHPYIHLDGWLAYWCGLVDTYPTDKNGDPECLTDEEAYIAYLANVTNAYPLNLKDPSDPRVAGYLRYLIAAKFGRPNYPVTREEFYLSIMKPPVVGNLTPASSIELDGVMTAPFISLEAYGDTSQQTYSGINLLRNYNTVGSVDNHGVRFTTNPDGSVTAVGTANGYADYYLFGNWGATSSQMQLPSGETSWDCNMGGKGQAYLGSGTSVSAATAGHAELTNSSAKDIAWCFIRIYTNQTVNTTFYPMVYTGHTTKSWEPYVGGVASPNPDYPQEVKTVTGRQVVETRSKNLVGIFPKAGGDNGITATYDPDTGWVELEGTATESWANCFDVQLSNFDHTKTYVMSAEGDDDFQRNIQFYSDTGGATSVGDNRMLVGENTHTVSISGDAVAIRVWLGGTGGKNLTGKRFRIQLEEANAPTDFVPFGGDYELNLGKNLFNKSIWVGARPFNVTNVVSAATGIRLDFHAGQDAFIGWYYSAGDTITNSTDKTCCIPVKPNTTYTIKALSTLAKSFVSYIDSSYKCLGGLSLNYATSKTFTTPDKTAYIMLRLGIQSNNLTTYTFTDLQIEEGETATSYAPYFEPIELCKIGDFQDYIYRDLAGNWKIHKAVGKSILDGVNFKFTSSGTNASGKNRFRTVVPGIISAGSVSSITATFCDGLKAISPGNTWNRIEGIAVDVQTEDEYVWIYIESCSSMTSSEFDTYMQGKKFKYYYPLREATDEELTNEELIAQLDALVEGGSYEGTTYITVSSEVLPALLKVEAAKDV